MVDEEVVRARLDQLEQALRELAEVARVEQPEYLASWRHRRLAERCAEVASQSSIDLASHLVASRGLRAPRSYADAFAILAEDGVLDAELADELGKIAGLRNLLVHEYLEVDHARLHAMIQDTTAFERFAAAVKTAVWG
jgi:uncharacterized protein YutE (UPF0331/DUF86 family)